MSRDVMQQALNALENHSGNYKLSNAECVTHSAVVDALREELAKPKPVPVAKVLFRQDVDGLEPINFYGPGTAPDPSTIKDRFTLRDVWLSPPQRQPLTDEDVKTIFDSVPTQSCQSYEHWRSLVARAIEAAHGIKENT